MPEPDKLFPLSLSDFEYYACRDETVDHPMVMVLLFHIEGPIDAGILRAALREALHHHPLLRCKLDRSGRPWQWKLLDDCEPRLTCTQHDGQYPPTDCLPPYIDLTKESGATFELRICQDRECLVAYLHHACVDGIGGIRFLADVFAIYGRHTSPSGAQQPKLEIPDPEVLGKRGTVPQIRGRNREGKTWSEWLRGPLRFLLGKNYCIPSRDGTPRPASDQQRNVLHTRVLPRQIVRQLKQFTAERQVSTYDVCMMVYLQQIAQWTHQAPLARDTDLLRILMPVSMRTPEHDQISAANVLSYVFQPYRRRDCRNPEALLSAIHRHSTEMIHGHEGAVLLKLFALVRRVPGLFWLSRKLQPSFATAVLANVGELKRVFGSRFPLKKGRVVAGNVVIQRIDGIAPLRKNTNVAISFGAYGGELIMNLRANPTVMSSVEAAAFLDQVVTRLSTLAETHSLQAVQPMASEDSLYSQQELQVS